jgi:uncharacterized delta-60 repeat protein
VGFTVNAMTIDPQGRLLLAGVKNGQFHVQRRSGARFLTVESASTIIDGGQQQSIANAVAVAPDGKVVLAGTLVRDNGSHDFAVARFNENLTIDDTFAGDGTQSSDFDGGNDEAWAVAVQDDLKIVVAGGAVIEGVIYTEEDGAVERFNENGTLDGGFADGGKFTFDVEAIENRALAVAIRDGIIYVAGNVYAGGLGGNYDFAVISLNSSGNLNGNFGGAEYLAFGGDETARAIALDPSNGTVVVAGGAYYDPDQIHVARLLGTGVPDSSFDEDGKLTVPIDGKAQAFAVFVQPDHKIVVAGRAYLVDAPDQFLLMRFNGDGALDPTFGTGGKVFTQFGSAETGAFGLGMRFDGSFVAAGVGQAAGYRSDGSLDSGGVVALSLDPEHVGAEATAVDVGSDGKLVVAGKVFLDGNYQLAAARYEADYGAGLDLSFGSDFPKDGTTLLGSGGTLEIRATAVMDDGKVAFVGQNYFNNYNWMVGRFTSDGLPDPACSGVGYNTLDFGIGDDTAAAIAVFGTKILAAGTVRGPSNHDFAVVRFSNVCTVDDAGGPVANPYRFQFDLGGDDLLGAMTTQGTRVVLAGTSGGSIVVMRARVLNATGGLIVDTGFGTAGRTTIELGNGEVVTGLASQGDGKLILSGQVGSGPGSDFFAARLSLDGIPDEDFGVGGIAFTSFNSIDFAQAMSVRDDDTIAMAGCTITTSGSVFAVAQLTADGMPDADFSGDGKTTVRTGPSGDECALSATYVGDGQLVVGGYTSVFGVREFVLAAFESDVSAPVCGDANADATVSASDALVALRTAVQSASCEPCVCDVNGSGSVAASDALQILRRAVGQNVDLDCPDC